MDLHSLPNVEFLESAANHRVQNIPIIVNALDVRPDDPGAVIEEGRQFPAAKITIAVDGRRQNGTAMLPEPYRIVGASPEEGYPVWGAGNDHETPSVVKKVSAWAKDSAVPMSMNGPSAM